MLNAQVKVLGKIEPNGSTDTYPTHVDSLGKGGLMAVGSLQERNAIPLARRKAGMLVRVKSATVDSTYTLNVGLTNSDWMTFSTGSGNSQWGSIGGVLANQVDLQNELDSKAVKAINITYAQLQASFSNNTLIPEQDYLLTDYQTIHTIPNTSAINTGPIEPLLVRASSTNTLYNLAKSPQYPQDDIFYTANNINGSTKGHIMRRHDRALEIELGFDFRNAKFRRWKLNPATWSTGTYNANIIVQHNNKIYYSLSSTTDEPSTGTSWLEILNDNTLHLSSSSTGFTLSLQYFGANITIPVNTADFVDVPMFSNYGGIACVKIPESSFSSMPNIVVYTDGQAFSFTRMLIHNGSSNLTFAIKGNAYCYQNEISATNSIFAINRTGSGNANYAISFNKLESITQSIINVTSMFYNNIRLASSVLLTNGFTYNNANRLESVVTSSYITANTFPSLVRNLRFNANNLTMAGCLFQAPIGRRYNGTATEDSPFIITSSLYGKTIYGNAISDAWTPTLQTDLATKNVMYTGLDLDISTKEDSANKATSIGTGNNTSYPTTLAVKTELDTKLTGTAATNLLNPNNSKFPTAQTMVNALAGYEQNTNKVTSLASANNTTYPTTQAVATGLTAKANLSGGNTFSGVNIIPNLHTYGFEFPHTSPTSQRAAFFIDPSNEEFTFQVKPKDGYGTGDFETVFKVSHESGPEGSDIVFNNHNIQANVGITGSGGNFNTFNVNSAPSQGTSVVRLDDIAGKANLMGGNTFKNAQVMNNSLGNTTIDGNLIVLDDVNGGTSMLTNNPAGNYEVIQLPAKSGVLALEDDIPNISGKADLLGANFIGTVTINPTAPATDDILTVGSSFKVSKYDPYGTITARGRSLHFNSTGGNSASLSVGNATEIGLRVNDLDNDEGLVLSPNYWSMRKGIVGMSLQLDGSLYQNVSLTFPTESGKLAIIDDIPKMFTYTSIEHTDRNEIEYNLGFTPTMAMAVINSDVAQNIVVSSVQISSSIITVQTSASLPAGTKFTIMVK